MTDQSNQPGRPDVIDRDRLRESIRLKYQEVAMRPTAEYHFFTGRRALDHIGYQETLLEDIPDRVLEAFAGVANPFHWGMPAACATVVDIGSGGGLDSVLAARSVGASGHVIGVDLTREMLDRAGDAAVDMGLDNLEFRQGLAEELPVDDGSVDLVISNGVLNLVPDKVQGYREVFRVLKQGGRFQIADIVVEKPVSEGAQRDIDLWTG
ncbi:MAG TPA: methyltransferase domain-containing protein [Acidimicrobiia bacterium]|nr:methyltransferase domain-containing protein [Acidimicrobiia bacterium]